MSSAIRTERLRLVPYAEPLQCHVDWLNDKSLMRYSENRHRFFTAGSIMIYRGSADYYWGIWASGLVGTLAAHVDEPNDVVDMGLLVAEQGKGYGLEAWTAALDYLKARHRKVTAGAMAANVAMVKIMQRTMKYEYTRPGYFLFEGQPMDSLHFARWGDTLRSS